MLTGKAIDKQAKESFVILLKTQDLLLIIVAYIDERQLAIYICICFHSFPGMDTSSLLSPAITYSSPPAFMLTITFSASSSKRKFSGAMLTGISILV